MKSDSLQMMQASMEGLQEVVKKGVTEKDGVYTFFDPGFPLVTQRQLPIVLFHKLIFAQDWYDGYDWATQQDAPQERQIRVPVKDSFNRTFPDQEKLLLVGEQPSSVRALTMFLIINALATGKRLLPDCYVRCIDKYSCNGRVSVGGFCDNGVVVLDLWPGNRDPGVGLAALRKS